MLLAAFSIAFLILYLLLSHNNRLATDDYFYLKNADQLGIWNGMLASYHSWVTRWMSILFLNCVFRSYHFFHSLLPFHLFTIIAFIFSCMNCIRAITKRFPGIKITFTSRLLYSVLFIASIFFFSFSNGESFFWIASATMYLWSIVFFIAGLSFIIQPATGWWTKIACGFCFLFIGGAGESVSINIFILLIAGLLFYFNKGNYSFGNFRKNDQTRMILIAIAALSCSLLISYFGEGRVLRQSALPETGLVNAFVITVKSFIKLILFYLPLKISWFLFFMVPWIYLGYQYSSDKKEPLEKVFGQLFRFVLVFLLLSFLTFIPISFLLGETGPFRTWILISFYLALCSIACGFYLGYKAAWNKKLLNGVFTISMLSSIALMVIFIMSQGSITSTYASAVDQRMKILQAWKEKSGTNTLELDELPPSGMLYSSEISNDSSHFSNQHLKEYLNLKFDIRKK